MTHIKLNKKYRIWWSTSKTIRPDFQVQMQGSTSLNNKFWQYFESDNLDEVNRVIEEKGLKVEEETS
jgi:hypothetical protein